MGLYRTCLYKTAIDTMNKKQTSLLKQKKQKSMDKLYGMDAAKSIFVLKTKKIDKKKYEMFFEKGNES